MNGDIVPYELAVKLKEKGFREKCLYRYRNYSKTLHPNQVETKSARKIDYSEFLKCYNSYIDNDVDAPTISQVLKWLREAQLIHICIGYDGVYSYDIVGIIDCEFIGAEDGYETSELAALAGVNYIIDNNFI